MRKTPEKQQPGNPEGNPDRKKEAFKFEVETANPDQWREYRDLDKIGMEEEPSVYHQAIAQAMMNQMFRFRGQPSEEQEWRERLGGGDLPPDAKRIYFGARTGKKLAGSVAVDIYSKLRGAKVHDLFIPRKYRGHGMGRKLMESVLNAVAQENEGKKPAKQITRMALDVAETQQAAIELYQSLGFEIIPGQDTEVGAMHPTEDRELVEHYMELNLIKKFEPSGKEKKSRK